MTGREPDGIPPGRPIQPPGDPGPPPSDADLLRRHADGDRDAFGLLFLRHRERLWAVALRTLGQPDDAADALQEAMISAFRAAGRFRGECAVTTWLHRIVVNACLDRMRRAAARPATSGVDGDTLEALAGSSRTAPVGPGAAEETDVSIDVAAALRTLPPEQRAALVLVDMLGYPVADAAEILQVPTGTLKSRCARGRARLVPHLAHLRGRPAAQPAGPAAPVPRNRALPGAVSPAGGGGESGP